MTAQHVDPQPSTLEAWNRAGTSIAEKMLGEFSYELLFTPQPTDASIVHDIDVPRSTYRKYRVELGCSSYEFTARRGALDTWHVAPGSATRTTPDGRHAAVNPVQLMVDARDVLGLAGARLADVLSELISTISNEQKRIENLVPAEELADTEYNRAEQHLPGHPRIVVNKGRVGFSAADRDLYSPESGAHFPLRWAAVHQSIAAFSLIQDLKVDEFWERELGSSTIASMCETIAARLSELGRLDNPVADYIFVPVHPWQWNSVIRELYAAEVATGVIIDLGESADQFLAHQTVRTLANISNPSRRDIKTACSVRNTLVYRGLDSTATLNAPAITDWLSQIHRSDEMLSKRYRFDLLGEVASVSVRHPLFSTQADLPYRFHETLGAIWRTPVSAELAAGERALSLATLPYRDRDARSVLAAIVEQSQMCARDWLSRLIDLELTPLLHWFYRYGVAFCPHTQNLVLVISDSGEPLRVLIKDFAQGVDLIDADFPVHSKLPTPVRESMLRWPAELMAQSLFSSVCSGQFRFLAEIAEDDLGFPRAQFWALVRDTVHRYRQENRDDVARLHDLDLFAPNVERVCLNREHLAGEGFERVDRDEEFDVRHGMVPNPLAGASGDGSW